MQKPLQPFPVDPRPLHALHGSSVNLKLKLSNEVVPVDLKP